MHYGSKVRYFYWEFDRIFLIPKSGGKYSINTRLISGWLLLRKMIISQLELGPPAFEHIDLTTFSESMAPID